MSQFSVLSPLSQPSFISQPVEFGNSTFSSSETNDGSENSPRPPLLRGWINEHFDKVDIDGTWFRVCKYDGCDQKYCANSSTNLFKKHWKNEHSMNAASKRTRFLFHDELHTNRWIKCVIALHLKYSMVDSHEFKEFVKSLNPNKTLLCRQTLSQIIKDAEVRLATQICDKLSNASSIALTFDIWSPRKGARGFGCVTAHYVSNRGLEDIILQFKRMKFPHNASVIRRFIEKAISTFKLAGRVAAITTDNASNNNSAIKEMSGLLGLTSLNLGFIHYHCVAHIIDLGMRECMKRLRDTIRPVRDIVMAVRCSRKRTESLLCKQDELIQEGLLSIKQPLDLIEDVDHRWNSAYCLLDRAYLLRDALDFMLDEIEGGDEIDPIDWTVIAKLLEFLKPFYEATKRLCSGSDVTISVVGYCVPMLINHCAKHEKDGEEWIKDAANLFHSKLTDYQLELYHPIVDLAYFLDPRYKTLKSSDEHRDRVVHRVRSIIEAAPAPTQEYRRASHDSVVGYDSDSEEPIDELKNYLETHPKRELMRTDVLAWWRLNAAKFPKLSALAQKILPIQATSVASERVFSVAGDVDTKVRNRLADESVESIVLLKSWMQFLNVE